MTSIQHRLVYERHRSVALQIFYLASLTISDNTAKRHNLVLFYFRSIFRKREQMRKKLKASSYDAIEKLLFHGTTSDVIDAICKQNFDHRMQGKNGTVYGKGSYFAVNASYSNKYSGQSGEKTRFMFLASVLTGQYILGGRGLRRPPLKDPGNPASDLYDSCVDKEEDPKIYVIFNDEQCYPLFLIKYRLQ